MEILPALYGQMITHVHPEIRRELEVVGMGGVIGLLLFPIVLRAEGIDWIGTALHRLPVAVHEGNARRKAVGGLLSLGELVFSRHVQHVPAVELEGNGVAEVQGMEHPVCLGQGVGQLPGKAFGLHPGKELQTVGLTRPALQVILPLSPARVEEGGRIGIEYQVLHFLVETADGEGKGAMGIVHTRPDLVRGFGPVLAGGRDEHFHRPAGGDTFQRVEELHRVVVGGLHGQGRGQFIRDEQVRNGFDGLVSLREEDRSANAGGGVERSVVIADLSMQGTAARDEGLAGRGGQFVSLIHLGHTGLEERNIGIRTGLDTQPGIQFPGHLHLQPFFHEGGLEGHPGRVRIDLLRLVLEGAESVVGKPRFPLPSGGRFLDPGQVSDQVAPAQCLGGGIRRVETISVITPEYGQEDTLPVAGFPGNLREGVPDKGIDVVRNRQPFIYERA